MKKFYDEKFIDDLKQRINSNEFTSKEEIISYIKNLPEIISHNPEILREFETSQIENNTEDLNGILKILLDYYDRVKTDTSSLNLDNVTAFKIDDKDYIKVANPDGSYTVLDDNMSEKDFVKQFYDKQNASADFNSPDGIKNRDEIVSSMQQEKETANLVSEKSVDERDLTPEERREFASIMHMDETKTNNFVVDTKRNMYINRDTGEVYYAHRNSLNQMEIRKVNETGAETTSTNKDIIDEIGQEATVAVDASQLNTFEQMDDYELEYTLNNRFDSLTTEQKELLKRVIAQRKALASSTIQKQNELENKPKIKTLTLKDVNKKYNGFTSIVFLCLLTSIYGTIFIMYLLISNGMLK